jgi:hypothetical protein
MRPAAVLLAVALPLPAAAYEVNGHFWPEMPIRLWVNPQGCPVMDGGKDIEWVVARAAEQWSQPPCSAVRFEIAGSTAAGLAPDGQSTVLCIDHDWNCGAGAAGCSLWVPRGQGETPENDIALNAADLLWLDGGPDATQTGAIDPVAVLTHELGHMVGLAHSPDPFATMYYGTLPNGLQATIAGDDRAGICALYPSGQPGCAEDSDCGPDGFCAEIAGEKVCDERHDGPGEFCSKTFIDCAGMCWVSFFECSQVCLFTNFDYSDGYCAPLCDPPECPADFHCVYLAQHDVSVCFLGEAPDGGGGGDGGDGDAGLSDAGDGERPDAEESATGDEAQRPDDGGADAGPDGGADTVDAGGDGSPGGSGGCGCGSGGSGGEIMLVLMLLVWARSKLCLAARRRKA